MENQAVKQPKSALKNIKILDLTTVVFGPYASQILADYGADVIKIEAPTGDSTRYTGPASEHGLSALFLGINRNKRSLVLDLKKTEAIQILHQLIQEADVIMHNIRPQKLSSLGLSAEQVHTINPRIIYAALTGFSTQGLYAGEPAYDDIIQGLSGIAAVNALQSGTPGYFPTIAADKTCALIAAHAILAALFQREHTQQGQVIEIPMFESMVSYMMVEHFYGRHLVDSQEQPMGYPRTLTAWRKPYQTTDGYISLMPYTDKHWYDFFTACQQSELAVDPRFSSISQRTLHIAELYELVGGLVIQHSSDYWLNLCHSHQIPAAPIYELEQLESDPHLQSIDFFPVVHSDHQPSYRFIKNPVSMQHSHVEIKTPPHLGEHSAEVLLELGLSPKQLQHLLEKGVTFTHSN